ncbi:TPA: TIGR03749 family integrating conjugative element protein [Klebsiella quasipneumoniae subsp. quasipneumoniae]|nr:TIGR03749 family integrating conjugative element protein [Klebsiella quasipneumoniae subsp. similipneumoniae]HBR1460298.1 TIGR03749 family integrating conjugative element protein [Klebsiella quasipneumoniae subsp. quasipneumoniae]HBR2034407.1 TIGR03749 family integrating conjugative element protein [Klebsiella quasipneumoniae subsp. quasipneumoniae]
MRTVPVMLFITACSVQATEILHWERLPLAVPLLVNQERVIFIDRNVRVGVPATIHDKLRVQSAAGAVYLKALEPVPTTRIQLQDVNDGSLILLDISATEPQGSQLLHEAISIEEEAQPVKAKSIAPRATRPTATAVPPPVALTRYAAQSLYAPLRAVEALDGVQRVSLPPLPNLPLLLPALPIKISPLAAWKRGAYQVAALKLTNTSTRTLTLDPRLLQGDFIAATFQHHALGASGQPTDTTVLYLITRERALSQSLPPAVSMADAAHNLPDTRGSGEK